MKCFFCSRDDFLTEEERMVHILQDHPEKTQSAEAYARAMANAQSQIELYRIAASLTNASFGGRGAEAETVLERFRFFVKSLYSVFREGGEN